MKCADCCARFVDVIDGCCADDFDLLVSDAAVVDVWQLAFMSCSCISSFSLLLLVKTSSVVVMLLRLLDASSLLLILLLLLVGIVASATGDAFGILLCLNNSINLSYIWNVRSGIGSSRKYCFSTQATACASFEMASLSIMEILGFLSKSCLSLFMLTLIPDRR